MEQQSTSPLALLLGLPLVAIGLAVLFAYLMGGNDELPSAPPEAAPSEYAAGPEPAPVAPASPRTAPTPPAPGPAPAAPPATQPAPPARTPPTYDAAVEAQRYQDPKFQQHAQQMTIESARLAMQKRDVEHLKRVREALRDPRMDQVIPPGYLEAMDVGIACLTRASGFRQRAEDFLDDNPSSPLAESVRGACN